MRWATLVALGVVSAACWAAPGWPALAAEEESQADAGDDSAVAEETKPSRDEAEPEGKSEEETARPSREPANVRQALGAKLAKVEFEAASVEWVLEALGEAGGFSIVFDEALEKAGIDLAQRTVTMRLTGMTLEDVIYLILPKECGYRVEAGYVLVTTLEKSWVPLTTALYDVQEDLAEVPNFQGPRFDIRDVTSGGTEGGGVQFKETGDEEEGDGVTPEQFMELIKRHVSCDNDRRIARWDDEDGPAAISYLDGKLIVSQTYAGQQAVAKFLMGIR